jgi:hypothetical protein
MHDKVEDVLLARAIAATQRFEIHGLKLGQSRAKHILAVTTLGTEFSPYTTRFRGQMGKAEGGLHLTALITLVCRHFCRYVHRIFFLMVESIFVARIRFCGHAAHVAGSCRIS